MTRERYSRHGRVLFLPDSFISNELLMPDIFIDGEIWYACT